MNLLDRYIFRSVLFTCLAAIALFSFVVVLPNVIKDLVGPMLAGQISPTMAARLIALIFPFAISFALPMGILTGVLLTLGRLSADSEVTAMRAAGIGLRRAARPIFILGALCTAGAVYTNLEWAPWARAQYHREFAAAVRANPLSFIVPRTFIRDFKGFVIYVGSQEGQLLRDIWVWELDDQRRVTRIIRAESGRLEFDEATNSLAPYLLNARTEERPTANPEDFSKSPYAPAVKTAGADLLRLSLGEYLGQKINKEKPEWMTFGPLRAAQARLAALPPPLPTEAKQRAKDTMKLSLILHEKFNLSLAVFSFALVGVPLGIKVSRRETSANLGLALLLVLGYYLLTVAVKWLDTHPEYHPDLLLWAPNLLFLGVGVWLFRRLDR